MTPATRRGCPTRGARARGARGRGVPEPGPRAAPNTMAPCATRSPPRDLRPPDRRAARASRARAELARERIAPRAADIDRSTSFRGTSPSSSASTTSSALFFDEQLRRHRHRRADGARRHRGGLEGVRDERPRPRGAGARLARAQARRHGRAEGPLPAETRVGRVARRLRADRAGLRLGLGRAADDGRRDGDELRPERRKRFITNAGVARLYTVFAKTDPRRATRASPPSSSSPTRPGFEVGRLEPKMGIAGSTTGELFFNGCRVPAENLLGDEGEGFRIAMRILDRSRPGIAAQGLGLAQGATDYALEYAQDAGDDGPADRRAPAGRGHARRHGDEVRGRARAALQLRRDGRRGRRRAGADQGLGAGEALLHRRGHGGDDRRGADPRRVRLHARSTRSSG